MKSPFSFDYNTNTFCKIISTECESYNFENVKVYEYLRLEPRLYEIPYDFIKFCKVRKIYIPFITLYKSVILIIVILMILLYFDYYLITSFSFSTG